MTKIILTFVLTVFSIYALAQERIQIKGKVVDGETKESLGFASVRLKNSFKGTITNIDGDFILNIDKSEIKDTLLISFIGYFSFLKPIEIIRNKHLFTLEPNPVELKELEVTSRLSADEIVKLAVDRIPINYPVKPYLMKAFYKKTLKENGKYFSLVEGAGIVIDNKGFVVPKNLRNGGEQIILEQARGNFALTDKGPNFIYVNYFLARFDKNMVKHLDGFFVRGKFQREADIFLDTTKVYVVSAESSTYNFKAWISAGNYAILKCMAESKELGENRHLDRGIFDENSYFGATRQVIYNEFQYFRGKYYPKYIKVEVDWNVYDKKTNNPIKGMLTTRTTETLVNDVKTDNLPVLDKKRFLNRRGGIEYQWKIMGKNINPEFWANYNSIARNPLENELLRDLKEFGPLEEQFKRPIPTNVQIKLFKNDKKYLDEVLSQIKKEDRKNKQR